MPLTKSAEALVRTVTPDGEEKVETELLKGVPWNLPVSPQALANLSVSRGVTIGLPNYSSARVDVSLTVPLHVGDHVAVYDWCRDWCNDKVQMEAKAITP